MIISLPTLFRISGPFLPTSDLSSWLQSLSVWSWLLISALIFLSFTFAAIYKRIHSSRGYSDTGIAMGSIPPYGWEELTRIHHNDVVWIVERDGRGPDSRRIFPRNDLRPSQIHINIRPRCPKCKTELKEIRRSFLGGYIWSCIKCSFKKRSKVNFYNISKDVEILARSDIEKTTGFSSGYNIKNHSLT